MTSLTLLCRSASTFAPDGSFDEAAHRQFLQQFIEARLGIYVGSAGSGEGLAMTADELRRMYRSAVAECKALFMEMCFRCSAKCSQAARCWSALRHHLTPICRHLDLPSQRIWTGTLDRLAAFWKERLQRVAAKRILLFHRV